MDLRLELMPPKLDQALVARQAKLADQIDGARPGQWEDKLTEFNRLADTAMLFGHFQGIYGGEDHEKWVRRVLYQQRLRPDPNLSLAEMTEIVSRIMTCDEHHEFFLELFQVNCKHALGSDLIFWPKLVPEFFQNSQPTSEDIAILAICGRV